MKTTAITLFACLLTSCSGSDGPRVNKLVNEHEKAMTDLRKELSESKAALAKTQLDVDRGKYALSAAKDEIANLREVVVPGVAMLADPKKLRGGLLQYSGFGDVTQHNDAYQNLVNARIIPRWLHEPFSAALAVMPRDPSSVTGLFNRFSSEIFQAITPEIYAKSLMSVYVDSLLQVHTAISKNPESKAWLVTFAKDPRFAEWKEKETLLAEFEKRLGGLPEQLPVLRRTNDRNKPAIKFWVYSFWMRRHVEGNDDVVHSILKQLKARYSR